MTEKDGSKWPHPTGRNVYFPDRPAKFRINRFLFFILYPITALSTFKPLRACVILQLSQITFLQYKNTDICPIMNKSMNHDYTNTNYTNKDPEIFV